MKYILAKGFIAVDGISLTARALQLGSAQRRVLLHDIRRRVAPGLSCMITHMALDFLGFAYMHPVHTCWQSVACGQPYVQRTERTNFDRERQMAACTTHCMRLR